jgi:hypothetical protein
LISGRSDAVKAIEAVKSGEGMRLEIVLPSASQTAGARGPKAVLEWLGLLNANRT